MLSIFVSTLVSILPVFLIIATGFGAGKVGILGQGAGRTLSRFVIWIALPCLMFDVVATTDWHRLWNAGFVAASVIGSIILYGAGLLIGRARGLSLSDMAVDGLNASYSNAAFIGLPLLALLLGPASRPLVAIAATLTLMILFALAVLTIELGRSHGHGISRAAWHALRGVLTNPVLIPPLVGLGWWMTGWTLPLPAERFVAMLGGVASPTALVSIGLFLAERPLRDVAGDRFVLSLSAAKLIVHPAITALLAFQLLALPHDIAVAVIMIAALPTGTGPFMVAEFYARDGRVTSGTIFMSTMLSVVVIAGLAAILGVVPPG
ncbi:AEC family transporter [Sphingobium sp. H39-3-25]|uniref:AEC family transporter n=1 Tax=Sphingobium arseniciresistens TaxID=3030834 RepID=UPI0023B9078D|nr:AEC family transporter [Sphingobium arseniciresistens]